MNIQQILDWHNIPYILSGKNVQHGNLNIKCPWCGYDDPSEHLGINLKTGYWACWRNQEHRGKRPHRLLMKLLNCSYEQVETLIGTVDRTQIEKKQEKEKSNAPQPKQLEFPKEIKPIGIKGSSARFRAYLERRGFNPVQRAIDNYGLCYSTLPGPWKDRLIVPVWIDGRLVTWTGRSIHSNAEIRYRTLSKENSVLSLKDTIWNFDQLNKEPLEHLVLVEGPFDALKLDFYGKELELRATCTFGLSLKDAQIDLLSALKFKSLSILLDSGTEQQALSIQKQLAFLRPKILTLPLGIEDPGNLSKIDIRYLRKTCIGV